MFLLLNTRAFGGNALKKWDRIKNSLPLVEFEAGHKVDNNSYANLDISNAILKGERKFIAAGGDGTINYLLNEILLNPSKTIIDEIQIYHSRMKPTFYHIQPEAYYIRLLCLLLYL